MDVPYALYSIVLEWGLLRIFAAYTEKTETLFHGLFWEFAINV